VLLLVLLDDLGHLLGDDSDLFGRTFRGFQVDQLLDVLEIKGGPQELGGLVAVQIVQLQLDHVANGAFVLTHLVKQDDVGVAHFQLLGVEAAGRHRFVSCSSHLESFTQVDDLEHDVFVGGLRDEIGKFELGSSGLSREAAEVKLTRSTMIQNLVNDVSADPGSFFLSQDHFS